MSNIPEPRLSSVRRAAELLGLSRDRVIQLFDDGTLLGVRNSDGARQIITASVEAEVARRAALRGGAAAS